MATMHERIALVQRLLAVSCVGRVRWPAWELRHALTTVGEGTGEWAAIASEWRTPRPFDDDFPGLGRVLAKLLQSGVLVHSPTLGCYVVDTWRLQSVVPSTSDGDGSTLAGAAAWLAQRDQYERATSNA